MKKDFKETAIVHKCEQCGGKAIRSEKGYKIANIVMTVSAVWLALSFFGVLAEEMASFALLFLVPSTAVVFYFLYSTKEGEYTCTKCKHVQTDRVKK